MRELIPEEQAKFHHRLPVQIRFNDVDLYGHVNNNSYFSYYDLGKEGYLSQVLPGNFRHAPIVPVIANINADFIKPIFHNDEIVVETRISHIGQKSFTLHQRAVRGEQHEVVCECRTVMVCFDLKTQTSAEMPEEYRKAILDFELG